MQYFGPDQFATMERFYRIAFFNTLSGVRTPFLAGTQGRVANLGLFNSVVHVGANPPLLGMVFRPASVPRHTLENIIDNGWYTLNAVPENLIARAHQVFAKYPREVSEFDVLGWKPHYEEGVVAPFVAETPLRLAMQLTEKHTIAANDTIFLVGEIKGVWIKSKGLAENGEVLHEQLQTALVSGLEAYYRLQKLGNQPYARP